MEYKVLVKLFVPEIEQSYEMYIPVNKSIGQVMVLLIRAVNSESANVYPIKLNKRLINRRTFELYDQTKLVRDTNIKNGTELIII